jgi:hypothetical protein
MTSGVRPRELVYKRTHLGGILGRSYRFDAVIGIEATGAEPRSFGVGSRCTLVGVGLQPERVIRSALLASKVASRDVDRSLETHILRIAHCAPGIAHEKSVWVVEIL